MKGLSMRCSMLVSALAPCVLFANVTAHAQSGFKTKKEGDVILKSDAKPTLMNDTIERIENYTVMFSLFWDALGIEPKSSNKIVVRMYGQRSDFVDHWSRNEGSNSGRADNSAPAAYWSPSANSIICYDTSTRPQLAQVLFHECSHQYMNRYTSDAPKWLNEGLAEYFEGWHLTPNGELAGVTAKEVKAKDFDINVGRRPTLYDLVLLQTALESGEHLRPQVLVEMEREDFNDFATKFPQFDRYLHYATSWGLVYYMLNTDHAEDHAALIDYLLDLRKRGSRAEFHISDWSEFEERFRTFTLALEVQPVTSDDHCVLGDGYFKSLRHALKNELPMEELYSIYQQSVAEYERAIELAQDDVVRRAGAHLALGILHRATGNAAEAKQHLEEAMTLDPANPEPVSLMARVELEGTSEESPPDPAKALEWAEKVIELDGGTPRSMELLARCQAAGGDPTATSPSRPR